MAEYAAACGKLLLEAKAKVPHGQWLPWLRANVAFGERSAQGYMRIASRDPNPQRVADMPLRQVLAELRAPLRAKHDAMNAELEAWSARNKAHTRKPAEERTGEEWNACIKDWKSLDEITHRYGVCPFAGTDYEALCLVCMPPDTTPEPADDETVMS
jgi:hypothetical protein